MNLFSVRVGAAMEGSDTSARVRPSRPGTRDVDLRRVATLNAARDAMVTPPGGEQTKKVAWHKPLPSSQVSPSSPLHQSTEGVPEAQPKQYPQWQLSKFSYKKEKAPASKPREPSRPSTVGPLLPSPGQPAAPSPVKSIMLWPPLLEDLYRVYNVYYAPISLSVSSRGHAHPPGRNLSSGAVSQERTQNSSASLPPVSFLARPPVPSREEAEEAFITGLIVDGTSPASARPF